MSYREKLIEALKNALDEYGVIKISTQIRDIIVEELEKDSKDSKWISVKERLPATGTLALVYGSLGAMTVARYIARNDWVVPGLFSTITHWMPLPEPPKEEKV